MIIKNSLSNSYERKGYPGIRRAAAIQITLPLAAGHLGGQTAAKGPIASSAPTKIRLRHTNHGGIQYGDSCSASCKQKAS
jgi:hypothetical protein